MAQIEQWMERAATRVCEQIITAIEGSFGQYAPKGTGPFTEEQKSQIAEWIAKAIAAHAPAAGEGAKYKEALERIMSAVGGNYMLPGCEEFYKGYNGGLRTCKNIAANALYDTPIAEEKLKESEEHAAHVRELVWSLRQIIQDLPAKRDWLSPDVEKLARAALAHFEKGV